MHVTRHPDFLDYRDNSTCRTSRNSLQANPIYAVCASVLAITTLAHEGRAEQTTSTVAITTPSASASTANVSPSAPLANGGTNTLVKTGISSPVETESVSNDALSSAEVEQLGKMFDSYHSDFRKFQLLGAASLTVLGAITIPVGIAIRNHSNSQLLVGPIVIGLGAGEIGGATALILGSSGSDPDLSELATFLHQERARTSDSSSVLRAVETEWSRRVDGNRAYRMVGGVLGMTLGVLGTAGGTVFALSDISQLSRNDRYEIAAMGFSVGAFGLIAGMRSFFFESPIEVAWKVRHTGQPLRSSKQTQFGVIPVPLLGGGALAVEGKF